MKAEIIGVGTELLLGHVINSDAAYVAQALAALGIDVLRTSVVGDNPLRLKNALEFALRENELVITTGGLGPTKDDLTKETASDLLGLPLEEDKDSLEAICEYFGTDNVPDHQYKQALIPEGAYVLANDAGTAPGLVIEVSFGKYLALLPGPPRELLPMLENGLVPFLKKLQKNITVSRQINTFGIGEGLAAKLLGNLLDGRNPTVAPYARTGEMFVKITAKAESTEIAEGMIKPVQDKVCSLLGDYVYGIDAESLEKKVTAMLAEKKQTVAAAESCTGGLLAKRITDQPGASFVFGLGIVAYSNIAKEKMLNVPKELIARHGAVSEEAALAMAENVRLAANSDFGIGITGIAGPDGGSEKKPLGLVYIALSWQGGQKVRKMLPKGRYLGREWVRIRAASHALDMLRRKLDDLPLDIAEKRI